MNARESVMTGRVPDVYLGDEERLRIRLCSVSVDSVPRGGGRASFELFSTRNEFPTTLTITVEAPKFRAAAAGGIPEPNYEQITAEAVARLREDLRAMLQALGGMPEDEVVGDARSLTVEVSKCQWREETPALPTGPSG